MKIDSPMPDQCRVMCDECRSVVDSPIALAEMTKTPDHWFSVYLGSYTAQSPTMHLCSPACLILWVKRTGDEQWQQRLH